MDVTRRGLLAGLGVSVLGGLAGCADGDRDTGLVAINHLVVYGEGVTSVDYPNDVGVRVTVENTANEGRTGALQVELRRVQSEDGDRTVTDDWRKVREVSLGRGQTVNEMFVFEDVAESDEEAISWEASAKILTDESQD